MNNLRRSTAVSVAVAVAAVLSAPAAGVAAVSPKAAAKLAAQGVKLLPDEQNASVVVVGGRPGTQTSVVVTPAGCASDKCKQLVVSSVPRTVEAKPLEVISLNDATSEVQSVTSPTTTAFTARSPKARAAVSVGGIYIEDNFCSNLGCTAWHIRMNSRTYWDGKWAWGTRSRYGYAGTITCTAGGVGYNTAQQQCKYVNDPSESGLYASVQYNISAPWPISISQDHYMHRHVTGPGGFWLVAN